MNTLSSTGSDANAQARAGRLIVAGYAAAALGLVAFLTINGMSGVSAFVEIGTTALVVIGLLLPAVGMLQLRRTVDGSRKAARDGLALQALGLVGLLLGLVPLQVSSSLSALYGISAVVIVAAAASAVGGASLTRSHLRGINAALGRGADYLILGMVLIFAGVALILGSNVASYFVLSGVGNTVYCDVGATISACGSVTAAYACFVMHARTRPGLASLEYVDEPHDSAEGDTRRQGKWRKGTRSIGGDVLPGPMGHQS